MKVIFDLEECNAHLVTVYPVSSCPLGYQPGERFKCISCKGKFSAELPHIHGDYEEDKDRVLAFCSEGCAIAYTAQFEKELEGR